MLSLFSLWVTSVIGSYALRLSLDQWCRNPYIQEVVWIDEQSLSVVSFRRLRLSYGLYMASVLFVVLMQNFQPPYPIAALPRYVLVLFPGFMVLGSMVKSETLHWAMIHFSTMLLSLFTAMFATWRVVA